MTYAEMQDAQFELQRAQERTHAEGCNPWPVRGATRDQLAWRAQRYSLCVACGLSLRSHSIEQTRDCANARS